MPIETPLDPAEQHVTFDPRDVEREMKLLMDAERYNREFRKIDYLRWYPWQWKFFNDDHKELMMTSANQIGKSYSAAAFCYFHCTGLYPREWEGRRFKGPIEMLIASETNKLTRDVNQKLMFGEPGLASKMGSGIFPLSVIEGKPTLAHGIGGGAYDIAFVKHYDEHGEQDGVSKIYFGSYAAGRSAIQGYTLHLVLFDESPPLDVYSEAMTRTTDTDGIVRVVFTPSLPGADPSIIRYFKEDNTSPDTRHTFSVSLWDCIVDPPIIERPWTKERVEKRVLETPENERDQRILGLPVLAGGRVFPFMFRQLACERIEARYEPGYSAVRVIGGIDFGSKNPALVVCYWNPPDEDGDACEWFYVHWCFKFLHATVRDLTNKMEECFPGIVWGYAHDGDNPDGSTGEALITTFKKTNRNIRFLGSSARNEGGKNFYVQPGIDGLTDLMQRGKFFVNQSLLEWKSEFEGYHRDPDNNEVVKEHDHLMDATRVCFMDRKRGKTIGQGALDIRGPGNRRGYASDINSDAAIARRCNDSLPPEFRSGEYAR